MMLTVKFQGRHEVSEAIYKMLAVKNGKKPSLGISKLGF